MKKVNVMFARFPGNFQEHPESSSWVIKTAIKAKEDPRVGRVHSWWRADTPIDMVRNLAVKVAQKENIDFLFMIDNDMKPDTDGGGEFWETAMDFLYGRIQPAVIAAPYVGGGEHNNIFVFRWRNYNNGPNPTFQLHQYTREEAAEMKGITEVAALPTGLIAYDMRVFQRLNDKKPSYFYYEMNDDRTEKQSTEDVTNTRDISLAWSDMEGAGCFCAWDCWADHLKIVPCGKPHPTSPASVGDQLQHAFEYRKRNMQEQLLDVGEDGPSYDDMPPIISDPELAKHDMVREGRMHIANGVDEINKVARAVRTCFADVHKGVPNEDVEVPGE